MLRKNRRIQNLAVEVALCLSVAACGGSTGSPAPIDSATTTTFPIPDAIVVNMEPYSSVSEAISDAINVNWFEDSTRAGAVTLGYAAQELQDHLSLIDINPQIMRPSETGSGGEIYLIVRGDTASEALLDGLAIDYSTMSEQGFEIGWVANNIYIAANTPTGLLYGVYRLLEHIGFAWYEPGEISVLETNTDAMLWRKIREEPRVEFRGFWIYGGQALPDDYAVWMARNRLNIAAGAATHLRKMLGMHEWGGGHDLLQQEFSAPEIFQQHPEWYSEINGLRRPVEPSGIYFNPAFGSVGAADFFADRLIDRLASGDLSQIDILNIWPSDSRSGRFDQSALAINVGNETDNLLMFYGNVAQRLRQAYNDGLLNRRVHIAGISYYETWAPPTNQVVIDAFEGLDYLHVFYLNERSWSAALNSDLTNRDANRKIIEDLNQWQSSTNLKHGFVEYFNYSIYAALALNDFAYIAENHEFLNVGDSALFGYMHPLLTNPGPRRLTNELLAKLGWEEIGATGVDQQAYIDQVIQAYFNRRYGEYASQWRAIYSMMAESVENAAEIFGFNSLYWLFFQDMLWADPPYTLAEAVSFIPLFREGGVQDVPTFPNRGFVRASFPGLDASIQLQTEARQSWETIMGSALDPDVLAAMESDVAWFEATRRRYLLMAATSEFVIAQFVGADISGLREQIEAEVVILESSATTNDTISPVNQRAFLDFHRELAGLESPIE